MVATSQLDTFRLLLDQGFPKPPWSVPELDRSVTVVHFSDLDPALATSSTPDWFVYCLAAEHGFHELAVRDMSQVNQSVEMYVLSRLKELTIVTWRKGNDDPIREWGQILAYLPQIRTRVLEVGGRILMLPTPAIQGSSICPAKDQIGKIAKLRGVSNEQVRHEAQSEITEWLEVSGESQDRFSILFSD